MGMLDIKTMGYENIFIKNEEYNIETSVYANRCDWQTPVTNQLY